MLFLCACYGVRVWLFIASSAHWSRNDTTTIRYCDDIAYKRNYNRFASKRTLAFRIWSSLSCLLLHFVSVCAFEPEKDCVFNSFCLLIISAFLLHDCIIVFCRTGGIVLYLVLFFVACTLHVNKPSTRLTGQTQYTLEKRCFLLSSNNLWFFGKDCIQSRLRSIRLVIVACTRCDFMHCGYRRISQHARSTVQHLSLQCYYFYF